MFHLTNPSDRYIITPLNKVEDLYAHISPIKNLQSKGIYIALTKITVKTPDIQNKLPNASKYVMSGANRKGFTCHQYEKYSCIWLGLFFSSTSCDRTLSEAQCPNNSTCKNN